MAIIMILSGCTLLGLWIAFSMKKRVDELRQVERIINHIEGEIRYNNALIREALTGASRRSKQPFCQWLSSLAIELEENYQDTFCDIWDKSLVYLKNKSHLTRDDIREIVLIGQSLDYLDMKSMEMGLGLQKESLHNLIKNLDKVLANNMKISVFLGILGGIFLVIILI